MPTERNGNPEQSPEQGQNPMQNQDPRQGLDPQQIEQFKSAFQIAKQFLYQEKVYDGLVEDLQSMNPASALAGAIVVVLTRIQSEVGELSLDVAAALGIALIDDVAQTLEMSGIMENTPEFQRRSMQEATMSWLQINDYPPEELAAGLESIGAPPEMIQQIMQAQGQPQEQGMPPEQGAPPGQGQPPQGAGPAPQGAPQSQPQPQGQPQQEPGPQGAGGKQPRNPGLLRRGQ